MAAVISEIAIRVRAITAPFTGALKKAEGKVSGFIGTITKVGTGIAAIFSKVTLVIGVFVKAITAIVGPIISTFKAIGGAVIKLILLPFKILTGVIGKIGVVFAAVAGGGLAIFIKKQFDLIDATVKTSRALKVNIDFLEGLKLAGSQLGVSNDKIIKSLKKFTRTMGEAKLATGAGATVFRVWGKNIEDFQNLNVEDSFIAIAGELRKLTDPTKQAAIAFQFFGRNGIEMLNIINANKGSIQDFLKESKRLKGAFDEIDTAKVEAANDAVDKMKISLEGVGKELSFILAPAIRFFADSAVKSFIRIRKKLEELRPAIEKGIVAAFREIAPTVFQAAKTVETIWTKLLTFLGQPGTTGFLKTLNAGLFEFLATLEFVTLNAKKTFELMFKGLEFASRIGLNKILKLFLKAWIAIIRIPIALMDILGKIMVDRIKKLLELISSAIKLQSDPTEKALKDFMKKMQKAFEPLGTDFRKDFEKGTRDFLNPTKKELDSFKKKLRELEAERKKFVANRKKDAIAAIEPLALRLEDLFKGGALGEGIGDTIADEIEDAVSKVTLEPKLAIKGSQEAAKLALGAKSSNAKIVENTKRTADNIQKMIDLMNQLRIPGGNIGTINPFDPGVLGTATGALV